MGILSVFDQVTSVLSDAWWTYPVITGIVAGDAVLPLLPGETAVVTGGVLSANGGLMLPIVILAGAVGAFLGDTIMYLLGRWAGPWTRRTIFSGKRATKTLNWAEAQLDKRGATIIIVARFVPGGRTATTFVAGATEYAFRRFLLADAIGAVIWSSYNASIGRAGGAAFKHQTWLALLLAFGIALLGAVAIEGGRRWIGRRHRARERSGHRGGS